MGSRETNLQPFRNVDVWVKAHQLTLQVFQTSEAFPKAETFGLSIQLRRASMNIPLKIAEGCGKGSDEEFHKCLQQARAATVELEYLLLLAHDLKFMETSVYDDLQGKLVQVRKMLSGFMKTLQSQPV